MTSNASEFGRFFRERRQALELNLSEFCRQNGFDKAHLSRLERGVSKPPKSPELLQTYADALHLKKESEDWKTFMRAALSPQGAQAELSRRLASRLHHSLVKARDLEQWSGTREAQGKLPLLVRQLVHASSAQLTRVEIPGGEGVQRHGWDGIVESTNGSLFVPKGVSGWEISVENNPKRKADKNFSIRTKGPLGLPASEVTFVFVTSRKWDKKQAWRDEKRQLGRWKSVEVYDSADLEAWLELAPGVDAWLAEQLGIRPSGVVAANDCWESLSKLSLPEFKPEVFLVTREKTVKELHKFLLGPPGILPFQCRSPVEAIDFVVACLAWRQSGDDIDAALQNEERIRMQSQTVLITDRNQWTSLSRSKGPLNLLVTPSLSLSPEEQDIAITRGHHVIIAANDFANHRIQLVELPRPPRLDLRRALEKSGFSHEVANVAARTAGGSLSVLKRHLSKMPLREVPSWCNDSWLPEFLPILLVGAWDDRNETDRDVLSRLSGRPYADVQDTASRLALIEDAPIIRFESRWRLVSPEDAWSLMGSRVTEDLLDSFESIATDILRQQDKTLGLSADDRFKASFKGEPSHLASANLKRGICETVAVLGAGFGPVADMMSASERAKRIVRNTLLDASWIRWTTLGSHLALLAEAAPDVIIEAIARDVEKKKRSEMAKLLSDDDGHALMSKCRHSGLLWAFECLAWSPDYFSNVCNLLAELAQIDTGKKYANKPINSLCQILLTWYPQTMANVDKRIAVLKKLAERSPDVVWSVLFAMLPNVHPHADLTHRPVWRDWLADWKEGSTNADYWKQTNASADLIIKLAGRDASRWEKILDNLTSIPEPYRSQWIDGLTLLPANDMAVEERRSLVTHARKVIQRHRDYSSAKWSLPEASVQQLEAAMQQLLPSELCEQHAWLFVPWVDLVGYKGRYDEMEQEIDRLRADALTQIVAQHGFDGVLKLADIAESPGQVGASLATTKLIPDALVLPALLNDPNVKCRSLAKNFARTRIDLDGWEWVDSMALVSWRAIDAATFLSQARLDPRAWKIAQNINDTVAQEYWKAISPHGGITLDASQFAFAIQKLTEAGRADSAISLLSRVIDDKITMPASFVMATLGDYLGWRVANSDVAFLEDTLFTIQELFGWLQQKVDIGTNESTQKLASLEWACLGLLDGYEATPKALLYYLSEDPKFFAEVIALIFRSTNESESEVEATEVDSRRASQAYRLLHNWDRVPGRQPDGSIDEDRLRKWIETARSICRLSGHLEVADLQIGEMLARWPKPEDVNSPWPCAEICDALEDVQSDCIDRGFKIGILNSRAVVSRSPFSGGGLERQESMKYRKWSELSDIDWTRVAAILRRVADEYEFDAKREDVKATERTQSRN